MGFKENTTGRLEIGVAGGEAFGTGFDTSEGALPFIGDLGTATADCLVGVTTASATGLTGNGTLAFAVVTAVFGTVGEVPGGLGFDNVGTGNENLNGDEVDFVTAAAGLLSLGVAGGGVGRASAFGVGFAAEAAFGVGLGVAATVAATAGAVFAITASLAAGVGLLLGDVADAEADDLTSGTTTGAFFVGTGAEAYWEGADTFIGVRQV